MNKDSKLKISEATLKDYEEIVELYNKNQVYQFSNGVPLSVRDLDLTMKMIVVSCVKTKFMSLIIETEHSNQDLRCLHQVML